MKDRDLTMVADLLDMSGLYVSRLGPTRLYLHDSYRDRVPRRDIGTGTLTVTFPQYDRVLVAPDEWFGSFFPFELRMAEGTKKSYLSRSGVGVPDRSRASSELAYEILRRQKYDALCWISSYVDVETLLGDKVGVAWDLMAEGVALFNADEPSVVAAITLLLEKLETRNSSNPLDRPPQKLITEILSKMEKNDGH